MARLRRTSLAALAWLTAFATLASGAPQVTCVCPDGRVMAFCLSVLPGASGCCCAGGPCRPTARRALSAAPMAPCCQARAAREAARRLCRNAHVADSCCHKTLTPSKTLAVPGSCAVQPPTADLQPAPVVAAAPAPPSFRTEERPPRHPPLDLTIVLQRLVI